MSPAAQMITGASLAQLIEIQQGCSAARQNLRWRLELLAGAQRHVQKEPRVEEGLDDRPGDLEPLSVMIELERPASPLRHDLKEPRVEREVGRQRLQGGDDGHRGVLHSEDLEALMIEAVHAIF